MKGHPWIAALGTFFVVAPLLHFGINAARGHGADAPLDGVDVALGVGGLLAAVLAFQRFK